MLKIFFTLIFVLQEMSLSFVYLDDPKSTSVHQGQLKS